MSITYVAKDYSEETHTTYRTYSASLGNPMIPAIGEYGYPPFSNKPLNQHEHR